MELARFPSHRGLSVRSIIAFVFTVLAAVLVWAILVSAPAYAATEASFVGETIAFDGHTYNPVSNLDPSHGLVVGTSVYIYYPPDNVESRATSAFFIYFAPGTDPPTAATAEYATYSYDARANTFSNPRDRATLTMAPNSQEDAYNSCTVTGGLGWIICPVTVFMAEGMDFIFDIIGGFLTVQPLGLSGDASDNGLYTAWNIMRNIANIAFVIAFLIIIYAQLTNTGLANYSLKKMIPRLVVAAILVNISYVISALAIDISNILGWAVQDIFNTIRKDVFQISDDTLGAGLNNGWTTVATLILGGGGAVAGIAYGVANGAYFLLIPVLLLVVLTALLVLVVLAARQAIIIILVIIAPLAFVANLLPNTEKWFTKWRDLFMTMLIFFPAFSLVYGGSQLAGQIIIMNTGDNIIMVIFGMAVQVAPLVITPLLLKLSGSLLGKIAQIANNPNKGFLDRNKKWAQDRAELARLNSVKSGRSPGAKMVRANEFRRRGLQKKLETAKQRADNSWHDSAKYTNLIEDAQDASLQKEQIETSHKAHLTKASNKRGSNLNIRTIELENAKVDVERATAESAHMLSAYRAGEYETGGNQQLSQLQRAIGANVIETAAWKQGEQNNQYLQQRKISEAMRVDSRLLDIAQGYGSTEVRISGRERAEANAVATLDKLNQDARNNVISLMETRAVENGMTVPEFARTSIINAALSDNPATRKTVSKSQLEAALEIAIRDGQVSWFDEARASEFLDQTIVDAVVARNTDTFKKKGGFHTQKRPDLSLQKYLAAFNKGDTQYGNSLDEVRERFFQDQKIARLDTLSNVNTDHFRDVKGGTFAAYATEMDDLLASVRLADGSIDPVHKPMIDRIQAAFYGAVSDKETALGITDRYEQARAIEEAVRKTFYPNIPEPENPFAPAPRPEEK